MNLLRLLPVPLVVLFSLVAIAAKGFQSQAIKPHEVPAEVAEAHKARYANVKKTAWRRNTWTSPKGKARKVFVAWFWSEKKAHRAAYTAEGKGYLTIKYLGGALGLPANIKQKLRAKHEGMKISAAQQYEAFTLNMSAYRVELREGATKVVTWTDKDGNEISKDNLPDGIEELTK